MAVDYAAIAVEVSTAFVEVSQGVILLIRESGETVPGENEWDPPVPADPDVYTLDGIAAAVTVDQANAKYIDGTVITTADVVITCGVPPVEPAMTDTLTLDGQARTIKKIVKVPAVGTPVLFKLFVQG